VSSGFSHIESNGSIKMVDVGDKEKSQRRAIYQIEVKLSPSTLEMLQKKALPKGDVLTTAKVAGIMAVKKTPLLIPLCHPLPITFVDIVFSVDETRACICVECEVRTHARTGVEMEAMVGAHIAALTIYDMCKAVQKDIEITSGRLLYKSGGKSGEYIFR